MAQEQAGRTLRSARWRQELTSAVLATWPAEPLKRTKGEWEAVRGAMTGGGHLPSGVFKASTRQIARFLNTVGHLPQDLFELQDAPSAARLLLLCACDRQQATIERSAAEPGRVLLRLQLPVRPDPRSYRDWTWVACLLTLPPTVPAGALLHLPTLRLVNGKVRADLSFTHVVPAARRDGHVVALGVDWGLNTLLSAGAARLAAWLSCGTARHRTRSPHPAGNGPGARSAAGRATVTRVPGSASPHAASPTSTRPSPTAPGGSWWSSPS
jgi:hypothetical protein